MSSFDRQRTTSWPARHRTLAIALGVLLLGSVGFAAAGGVEMVRSWFVTIEVNGEVLVQEQVEVDDTGAATIPLPEIETDGEEAEISISLGAEGLPDTEAGERTINVSIENGQATIQVEDEEEED